MTQFEIVIEDRPGQVASVAAALASINVRSLTTEKAHNSKQVVRFMTIDADKTRNILKDAGFNHIENDVLLINLRDRPGELAKVTKELGNKNINIDALYLIDRSLYALQVPEDHVEAAKVALGDKIVEA